MFPEGVKVCPAFSTLTSDQLDLCPALGRFSQFRSQSEIILLMDRRDSLYLGAATVPSELPLGEGFLDLATIVSLIRAASPSAHLILEMITRDPLKVPCLTDKYWAAFPERNGLYLAKTLKLVAEKTDRSKPLPRISQLPKEQIRMEQENVKACMAYAKRLNLA